MQPKGIVIHHSWTKDGKVVDYDAIKKYHIETNGWSDIGYHFVIEQQGDKVVTITGRDMSEIGAHCQGKNDHIGICVVGNYDVGHDVLSEEKMEALVVLCKNLMSMFEFTTMDISRHNQWANKTCPGSGFPWAEFISRAGK